MKNLIMVLASLSTTAFAADLSVCEKAVQEINNMKSYSLGSDGCNSYGGQYIAKMNTSDPKACGIEVEFVYGGSQVQCDGYGLMDQIFQLRLTHRVKRMDHLCKKLGLTKTVTIEPNAVICE